jgi:hypothetical protein
MTTKRKWWLALSIAALAGSLALYIAASAMKKRFDPYIRQQVREYLEKRFDSEVEIGELRIQLPEISSLRLLLTRRRGAFASISGESIVLRHKGRRDVPPLFLIHSIRFNVDLSTLFNHPNTVMNITMDGMEINIPPKGSRMKFDIPPGADDNSWVKGIVIDEVVVRNSSLSILQRNPSKPPLRFDIHEVVFNSVARETSMRYSASLTNARPPGEILAEGSFGPWNADEPGDTPIGGHYRFDNADLGVFTGISGLLHSTGDFSGFLDTINVEGEADVPDFRLKRSGNIRAIRTKFQAEVDGTNGNTILKPVTGTIGSTAFTTSGAVIKHENDKHRMISLDVSIPNGDLRDLLALAMKGKPFMEGRVALKSKIVIPPLSGTVREKLELDGMFEISNGKFLQSQIQDKIDTLSRRSQGQPGNQAIDEVVSQMGGQFKLDNEIISFTPISFAVPGSGIDLSGSFDMDKNILEFHGTLRMQAKISQTVTGWKHWLLKPVDPFFSKQGAGTLLKIKVSGNMEDPHFGLDR